MNFTKEQEQAIFTRGKDILVSAGAGAGKTRVLVTRISEMILDSENPVSADEMLVLTFTNAAAREMKERISKELEDRLAMDSNNRRLRQQIRVVKHADISTVHSFCTRLIRTHFNELGIDPSFRIAEEGELKILKEETMRLLMEKNYLEGSREFLDFVEAYAPGKSDHQLEEMIEKLYNFSKNFPNSDDWFERIDQAYADMQTPEGLNESAAFQLFLTQIEKEIQGLRNIIKTAMEYFGPDAEPIRFYEMMQKDKDILEGLEGAKSYEEMFHFMKGVSFDRAVTANKKEKEWPYISQVKSQHDAFKKRFQNLGKKYFTKTMEQMVDEQKKSYPIFSEFIRLGKEFAQIYAVKKKERNLFDFDDLEQYALRLLVESYDEDGNAIPSRHANEIAKRYKALFVDEYQDTNLVQEMIITTLKKCGQGELFVVGDVKQSIYRFRHARPDLFLDRYDRYEKGEGLKIELRDNFRSSPDVLEFCNRFFYRHMKKEFGGIDYTQEVSLRAGENGPMKEVCEKQEALLLVKDKEIASQEEDLNDILAEAVMIADRIDSLLEEGYDYKDIVILLRSMKKNGQIIADYLEERRIEALCESETGYFQTREIRVMLNYLSLVDNVYQDVAMASALLSGIGGMSSAELAQMLLLVDASVRKEITLYEVMKSYLIEGRDSVIRDKIQHFLAQLDEFRQKKQEMLLHELIWDIYEKTGFYEKVLSMPNGENRRNNLLMLMRKAQEYENTMFKGLFYFIRYMEQLRTYEVELGGGSIADHVDNAVKIMTIHKSKGLEYPVVFVSRLGKKINDMDSKQSVVYHPELGIGMNVVDLEERSQSPSIIKSTILGQIRKETLEEELRILYVALTRAQKKIILTGLMEEKKYEEIVEGKAANKTAEEAVCMLDWVAPVLYDNHSWTNTTIYDYAQIIELMEKKNTEDTIITLEDMLASDRINMDQVEMVEKAFLRVYPHQEAVSWKRKYSVSELKKIAMQGLPEEEAPYWEVDFSNDQEIMKPAFLQEKEEELTGTAYGTMIHKIMELLPFGKIHSKKDLFDELQRLYERFPQITEGQKKKCYKGAEAFLFSEEGEMIRQMDKEQGLYKEYPFTFGVDTAQVYPGTDAKERIIVQGIIDLYGESQDGLWLIDYKTDHILEGEESKLLDRYKEQMLYYRLALEQMLQKKVNRTLIYSFALQKYIEIFWD